MEKVKSKPKPKSEEPKYKKFDNPEDTDKVEECKNDVISLGEFIVAENIFVKDKKKQLYFYDGIKYNCLIKRDIKGLVRTYFSKYSFLRKQFQRSGFVNQTIDSIILDENIKTVKIDDYEDYIAIKNGLFNIHTQKITPYSQDIYLTSIIENLEYKKPKNWELPSILNECPNFSKYLFSTFNNDMDTIENIAMMIGCLLSTSTNANKFFILNGPSGAGKSPLINLIKSFFIKEQRTSLSLKQISKVSGFERETLLNSRINLVGDEERNYLTSGEIKRITSQDNITIQQKNIKAADFTPKFKIIAATNALPKFDDESDGIANRLLIINFKNIYKKQCELNEISNPETKDIYLEDKTLTKRILKNEMSSVLNFGIWGLKKFYQTDKSKEKDEYEFIYSKNFKEAIEKYKKNTNSLYEFLVDTYQYIENLPENEWLANEEIKQEHNNWYRDNVQFTGSPKITTSTIGANISTIFKCESKRLYKKLTKRDKHGNDIIINNKQYSCYSLKKKNEIINKLNFN